MKYNRILIGLVTAVLFLGSQPAVGAQDEQFKNLSACKEGAFSTEQAFMMDGKPFDGDPHISDGDVLSPSGEVCVRNIELLQPHFDVSVDLGLDGLDILNFSPGLIAFSTEIDSPFGSFTSGDLLVTNGLVIPNVALVSAFGISHDVGLDELKFMGNIEDIQKFVDFAGGISKDEWKQNILPSLLKRFNIDIWFTTEESVWGGNRTILDGDLLSATGNIIATNRDLLEASVPAGLPNDGVDFGLDAFAIPREAIGKDQLNIIFSTEILYNGKLSFTDGDVLLRAGGVIVTNDALIKAFNPKADFLGLDALWMTFDQSSGPHITHLCDIQTIHFNGGTVPIGGSGTGLHESPLPPPALTNILTRPCGQDVPIRGFLTTNPFDPVGDVVKFRVAYREVSEPLPAIPGDPATSAVQTSWRVYAPQLEWNGISWQWQCTKQLTLSTDANGWMNAQDFVDAKEGLGVFINSVIRCENPELRLAVWSTLNLPVGEVDAKSRPTGYPLAGVQDREDHYVLWLEWQDTSSVMHRESADHHLQLDNTLPRIADYPDGLQVRLPDGTVVPACGKTGPNADVLQIFGQFDDRFYSSFSLVLKGGDPPTPFGYGQQYFYNPDDGTSTVIKATDTTGTMPDATTVHLRNINMTDLGDAFVNAECCYYLEMRVYDRAIRNTFDGENVNVLTGGDYSETFITFAAQKGP